LCREKIECGGSAGERVAIRGRIFDGDGQPVPDAVLEIWQAGGAARGDCEEQNSAQRKKILAGFGRIATNERGEFQFSTIKPSARRDEDGLMHAPHLAVVLLMRGLLRHLLTRIYFAGDAANGEDVVLKLVPPERRRTLLAEPVDGSALEFSWDIYLQGGRETVFFEA
ncbi:MAG TPA: protocatechuate 3,4-dioxygenase subunit alpha, partial [Candidatus Bathyarchaeia archaeon]|nr:protocatechuate 3,4-dioxygenase subunit alpha [Candidatus Bathyarchaeia archaeon]